LDQSLNWGGHRAVLRLDGLLTLMNGARVPAVQSGTTGVLLGQVGVLGALSATVGLSLTGWLVGLACGAAMAAVAAKAARLGPADRVTMARAVLVGGVAALTADAFRGPTPVAVLVTLTAVALVLDSVDGQVARRTGTVSELGARLDMEVDAFLILVLSVYVASSVGAWVLVVGVARYALLAAGLTLPWLREQTPPRYWGKVVAAATGVALTVAAAGVLPSALTTVMLVVVTALLAESFGRQVWWLWRHRVTVDRVSEAVPA
jgi:phosphatidylglycerophosphate synthase